MQRGDAEPRSSGEGREEPSDGNTLWLVVFLIAGQRYGLDLRCAERVLRMVAVTPLPGGPDVVVGAINVHGDAVAVVDLARRLGHRSVREDPGARLLLARTPSRVVALPVEEVLGACELAESAVLDPEEVVPGLQRLSGVVADAEGLLLIHDLETLLSSHEDRQLASVLEGVHG